MERQRITKSQKAAAAPNKRVQRQATNVAQPRLVGLHSAVGNQAMRRLIDSPFIQAKLEVSQPGDPSEQEADRVANTVMRMPDADAEDESGKKTVVPSEFTPEVQKKTADEEKKETVAPALAIQRVPLAVREDDGDEEKEKQVATKPEQDATLLRKAKADEEEETEKTAPPIQRQREEEEEEEKSGPAVQPQSTHAHTPSVTPSVASNIRSMNGAGSPLSPATRSFFEPRFGSDFSNVRVHTDSRAAGTAKSLQARAFTVGQNIAFASGQYAPESESGRHLLAHELTHVVQQNGSQSRVNSSPDLIQRDPDPPPPSHGPQPPPLMSPIELKGEPLLKLPDDLAEYIKARQPLTTWVAVKFGTLMSNELPIKWNGTGFDSAEPPKNHDGHPMPIKHPDFPIITGARPMLAINIREDVVEGFLGWQTSASLSKNPEKFYELHPLSELLALEGLKTDAPALPINYLSGGKLVWSQPITYKTGEFEGAADATLQDEKYDFKGEIWVNEVKGIDKPMPIKKEGKKLFGDFTWKFNRSLGTSGKLSGQIIGTFAGGKPDVRGTLNYTRSKPHISGTVTVLVTSFDLAKDAVMSQLGPDAPSKIDPADPDDSLAITGWGHLDFAFNEWMTGNADVIVHPEGYVTAKGEIVPDVVIPILKKREKEPEPLFDKSISKSIPGLDAIVADVSVVGSLKIEGYASLGPGTLHDLRVTGLFSTHPDIVNTFELSGIMSTPAVAGLQATAEAKLAAQILKGAVKSPLSTGVRIIGKLELQLYAEAAAAAGRRKGDDDQPEYFLKGTLKGGAGLRLDLALKFFASVLFWEKHVDVIDRSYLIAGGSVTIDLDYTIGKKATKDEDALKLNLSLGSFDQNEFAEAVLRGKTTEADKGFKGKQQEEGELDTVPNPNAPTPVQPPTPVSPGTPGTPPATVKTLDEPLTMENVTHHLKLTISDPAEIEMESAIEPLLKKIERARKELKKSSVDPAEKSARLADLNKIEASANAVQIAAENASKNPAFINPQVPGFQQLAEEVGAYGDAYNVTDLGTALESIIVDPKKPETVLFKFPGLASDSAVVAQVSFLIAAGVAAEDLRKVVENVRPVKEDGVKSLLTLLEKMVKSGATNWESVITDLRIGGNKFKGAKFVISYIDSQLGWNNVALEVRNDDPVDNSKRRWDARIGGRLFQFKAWYVWPDIANRTFLRQILEDYRLTRVGEQMGVSWVFETSMTRDQIIKKMKDALAGVVADLKAGKDPKVPGYTGGIALFIFAHVDEILLDVVKP